MATYKEAFKAFILGPVYVAYGVDKYFNDLWAKPFEALFGDPDH